MVKSGAWIIAALALVASMLTGCRAPIPGVRVPENPHVGSIVHSWSEGVSAEAPGVLAVARDHRQPRLITEKAQWRTFVDELPTSLRTAEAARDIDRVTLKDSVVVIATYGKCTEVGHLESRGSGALHFGLTSDSNVNCVWAPTQLEVWQVHLDDLRVTDRSDVHLVD